MTKKDLYISFWLFSFIISFMPLFFINTEFWYIGFMFSFGYKFLLGLYGVFIASKNWPLFQQNRRLNKKPLTGFFIVAAVFLQIVVITLVQVVFSASEEIASGSGFMLINTLMVVTYLAGIYCWEVEFLSTVKERGTRIAFGILTPLNTCLIEVLIVLFSFF